MKTIPRIKISGDLQTVIQDKLEQGTSEAVFAAAPALLEVAKQLVKDRDDWLGHNILDRPKYEARLAATAAQARAAIAQAEGRGM